MLDELGLPAALTWLAEQMPLYNLAVEVRLERDQVSLPDDQAILLFQSVRELLINVAKHAGIDRATVTLPLRTTIGCASRSRITGGVSTRGLWKHSLPANTSVCSVSGNAWRR